MDKKTFTLSEANALLPQLKADLAQLQNLAKQFEERYLELEKAKAQYEPSYGRAEDAKDPFFEAEGQLDFMRVEADLLVANFERKGVLLKMVNPGLIDFPAIVNGEHVLICWKEGEERITHYHGWHDGFQGRKPLPDA
ncbi:DUF2203 domain-containing protein [Paenibacillus mendelii]|uniref:DUF2203 domain-containing protein n=1 Tax=Paenibacillus mendelii TaxID=206163 RepID=A0ABV6J3X5_9BACL|nr:DUF2203 domain-containing protein [Paenibacillus mendelii]MCQ6559269.1 DUF2203 domain-containing protein [Paenibacillus mendelii]